MSEYFNPNQDPNERANENVTPENTQPNPTGSAPGATGQPGEAPPHNAEGYRPPYYADGYRQQPPPPQGESTPPQQYSTTGGWQQRNGYNAPPPPRKEPYQWNFAEYEAAQAAKPKRRNKGLKVFAIIMGCVLIVSVVSFAGIGIYSTLTSANTTTSEQPSMEVPSGELPSITLQDKPDTGDTTLPDGRLTTEQIVEKVEPSIVAITTYINYQNYQASGMGSGIIIREDGYIVTNAHVVEDALGITVSMSDGTEMEGRIIGTDTKTDLAVIKIEATGLKAAEFGNSEQIKVGEKVLAIGTPQSMEFYGSVTQGIVSGLNRSVRAGTTSYTQLIQTDAAINPGNSGGALVNEYGQIIGINSAKVVAEGAEGMGFAIPASTVQEIINDLIAYGRVTGRVRLGITATAVDEVLARLNSVPTGLFVQSTESGSDISKQGVIPGDIITKVDGNEINSFQSLTDVIQGKKPGDTVELEIYRPGSRSNQSGRFFTVHVKLLEDMGETGSTTVPQIPQPQQTPQQPETAPPQNEQQYPDAVEDFLKDFFG